MHGRASASEVAEANDEEEAREEGSYKETMIGVVGQTGSGKSALLNAILDEEQLVPSNCMCACTAVVTKIAFQNGETEKLHTEHVLTTFRPRSGRESGS